MSARISNKPNNKPKSEPCTSAFDKSILLESQFETLNASIINLLATVCEVPVALIAFVDSDRILYKSEEGYSNIKDIRRRDLFCELVASTNNFLEIKNITKDILYQAHNLDFDDYKFRFFAGAPINLPLGEMVGILCILDIQPRHLTEMQREVLIGLADVLSKTLVSKTYLEHAVI